MAINSPSESGIQLGKQILHISKQISEVHGLVEFLHKNGYGLSFGKKALGDFYLGIVKDVNDVRYFSTVEPGVVYIQKNEIIEKFFGSRVETFYVKRQDISGDYVMIQNIYNLITQYNGPSLSTRQAVNEKVFGSIEKS